jgi:hypothetical protein
MKVSVKLGELLGEAVTVQTCANLGGIKTILGSCDSFWSLLREHYDNTFKQTTTTRLIVPLFRRTHSIISLDVLYYIIIIIIIYTVLSST